MLKKPSNPQITGSLDGVPLGETWEVSIHRDGVSKVSDKNINLDKFVSNSELPYLVKFIDTADNLSVQVHPNEEYAQKFENDNGKSECWIILEADENSGIYLGLKKGVTKQNLSKSISKNEDVSKLLNFYPVKKGDFFFVDTGTIHAIGKNITLCEVQQSSGVTYRVWDWNRLDDSGKGRELHINKAMDVINFDEEKNDEVFFKYQRNIFSKKSLPVISHRDFEVHSYNFSNEEMVFKSNSKRAVSIIVLEGTISIGKDFNIVEYEACLFTEVKEIDIKINGRAKFLIIS